jgi:hypothetical protein
MARLQIIRGIKAELDSGISGIPGNLLLAGELGLATDTKRLYVGTGAENTGIALEEELGDITALTTTANTDVVSAINELVTGVGSVSGKADKVASPTAGNFGGLNGSGNLTDSGSKAADFATALHDHNTVYSQKPGSSVINNIASYTDTSGNLKDSGKAFTVDTALGGASTSDTKVPSEKAVKAYVDSLAGGTASALLSPVADLAAMKALDTTSSATHPDKIMINVETLGLYRLDRESVSNGDDNLTVEPTTGTGRWLKMSSQLSNHDLLTSKSGGTTGQYNHITDAELAVLQNTSGINTGDESNMVGDSGSGGTAGLVPAPTTGDATKFLKGDGTWETVSAASNPGHEITEEGGAALTTRTSLNFVGASVTANDNSGNDSTDITILNTTEVTQQGLIKGDYDGVTVDEDLITLLADSSSFEFGTVLPGNVINTSATTATEWAQDCPFIDTIGAAVATFSGGHTIGLFNGAPYQINNTGTWTPASIVFDIDVNIKSGIYYIAMNTALTTSSESLSDSVGAGLDGSTGVEFFYSAASATGNVNTEPVYLGDTATHSSVKIEIFNDFTLTAGQPFLRFSTPNIVNVRPNHVYFADGNITLDPALKRLKLKADTGGSALELQDETVSLSTAVTKIDFAGAGVTATQPGTAGEILVTIPGGGGGSAVNVVEHFVETDGVTVAVPSNGDTVAVNFNNVGTDNTTMTLPPVSANQSIEVKTIGAGLGTFTVFSDSSEPMYEDATDVGGSGVVVVRGDSLTFKSSATAWYVV